MGPYTVHLEKHLVYCGSESISLTVKEYDLCSIWRLTGGTS